MSTDMESGFRDSYKIDDKCDRFSYEDILCGDSYLARIDGSNTRSRSNIGYHSRDCLSSSRNDSSSSSSSSSSSDSHGFSSSNSDSWSSDSSNSNSSSYDSFIDETPLNVTVKVYSLDTNRWKTISAENLSLWLLGRQVFVSNASYWIGNEVRLRDFGNKGTKLYLLTWRPRFSIVLQCLKVVII